MVKSKQARGVNVVNHIHIIGASGVGTTTLAKALSIELGYAHFDTDDYYWLPTSIPFTEKRSPEKRIELLNMDLSKEEKWILSGSLCGWGDRLIPAFELVVFLSLPKVIRMERLVVREKERAGKEIEPNGSAYDKYCAFMEWAGQYDDGGLDVRSRALHDLWLSKLPCDVLKIEGDKSVEERISMIRKHLK
jgi:adenylate kinase family enzyme